MALLALKNVSKSYGALKVTDDVSLSVNEGEVLGILGPNGAGKSTSMRMMVGLTTPTSGSATIASASRAACRCRSITSGTGSGGPC